MYVAFVLKQLKIWGLYPGNPLAVQWLGLHAFTAEGVGLIPRQGTNILQAGRAKGKKMQVLKSHTNGHSGSERTEMEARHQGIYCRVRSFPVLEFGL